MLEEQNVCFVLNIASRIIYAFNRALCLFTVGENSAQQKCSSQDVQSSWFRCFRLSFSFLQSCICWWAIKYLCCRGIVAGLSVIWMVTKFSPNAWLIIGGCIWLLFTLLFTRLFNSNLDFAEPQNILLAHWTKRKFGLYFWRLFQKCFSSFYLLIFFWGMRGSDGCDLFVVFLLVSLYLGLDTSLLKGGFIYDENLFVFN